MLGSNDDAFYFNLRKEGKIYVSEVFSFPNQVNEIRNVKIVFENSTIVIAGEVNGLLALRQSQQKKQQIIALISQDDKQVKRLTFQRFDVRKSGDIATTEENSFTFRADEFNKLISFLKSLEFIDFSNRANFQIEDLSSNTGNKAIVDSIEKNFLSILRNVKGEQRTELLNQIKDNLSKEDIQLLLGRKEALTEFNTQLSGLEWNEPDWQRFFESQKWIFGYGLDYRFMTQFDREMNVSAVGTDNKEKVILDFLMTFNDFTVTVEIKRPDTPIFNSKSNRSGAWSFHSDFFDAVSQVLEQKTEWHILGQNNNLYNKEGTQKLSKRTRDAKAILVIGNKSEFLSINNVREREIKQDTFELFRRDSRNLEIITYDELYARACFIVTNNTQ